MGKVIKNLKRVNIIEEDGILRVSMHYGVSCEEYPYLEMKKDYFPPTLTPQEQAVAQQVMDWATGKINQHEGI